MNNNTKVSFSSVIILICLLIVGNASIFIVYGSDLPECGLICLVFYNIAVLCTLLPAIAKKVRNAAYLAGSLKVLCSIYFIIESLLVVIFLNNDTPMHKAAVWQLVFLILFIIVFVVIDSSNRRTSQGVNQLRESISYPLREAAMILNEAMAFTEDAHKRRLIRAVLDDISSTPYITDNNLYNLDEEILLSVKEFVNETKSEKQLVVSCLVRQRNGRIRMIRQMSQ